MYGKRLREEVEIAFNVCLVLIINILNSILEETQRNHKICIFNSGKGIRWKSCFGRIILWIFCFWSQCGDSHVFNTYIRTYIIRCVSWSKLGLRCIKAEDGSLSFEIWFCSKTTECKFFGCVFNSIFKVLKNIFALLKNWLCYRIIKKSLFSFSPCPPYRRPCLPRRVYHSFSSLGPLPRRLQNLVDDDQHFQCQNCLWNQTGSAFTVDHSHQTPKSHWQRLGHWGHWKNVILYLGSIKARSIEHDNWILYLSLLLNVSIFMFILSYLKNRLYLSLYSNFIILKIELFLLLNQHYDLLFQIIVVRFKNNRWDDYDC